MNDRSSQPPPEVCLLLRAHSEARWLSKEVVPVLRELEREDGLPSHQLGAALAYLEVVWIEARRRAAGTDEVREQLEGAGRAADEVLRHKARCYHAAVRRLRHTVARRVARRVIVPDEMFSHGLLHEDARH
jgi:hypothetical protein